MAATTGPDGTGCRLGFSEAYRRGTPYPELEDRILCHVECLARDAQWGLERAFKGLLAAGNDTVRFRRDAALMWRHVEGVRPTLDRGGAQAMEDLLAATTGPDGTGCRLDFHRVLRGLPERYPVPRAERRGAEGSKALDKARNRRPDIGGAGPVGSGQGRPATGRAWQRGSRLAANKALQGQRYG